jgi:hypothetical protein
MSKANRTPADVAYDLAYHLRQRAKVARDLVEYDNRVNELAAELWPACDSDGQLLSVGSTHNETVVEIWLDEEGQVQAQIVETTPFHKLQWPINGDPAPTQADLDLAAEWASHTVNPAIDALSVALIDGEAS